MTHDDIKPAVLTHKHFQDGRGYLNEVWKVGDSPVTSYFQQVNMTFSKYGVIRGLHFSRVPQGKLVTCVSGAIIDMAVDLRLGSPNFGVVSSVSLEGSEDESFWVPPGFGHAFQTVSETSRVVYLMSSEHNPAEEFTINPLDAALSLPWSDKVQTDKIVLSVRDKGAPSLLEAVRADLLPKYPKDDR